MVGQQISEYMEAHCHLFLKSHSSWITSQLRRLSYIKHLFRKAQILLLGHTWGEIPMTMRKCPEDISGIWQIWETLRQGIHRTAVAHWLSPYPSTLFWRPTSGGRALLSTRVSRLGWKEEEVWRTQLFRYKSMRNPMGFVANNRSAVHKSQGVETL